MNETLGHEGKLEDGVSVLHRDDSNYWEVTRAMCDVILEMIALAPRRRTEVRRRAAELSDKARWTNFIRHYYQAWDFALRKKQA